ncbi:MAG: hypothetical protein R6V32_06050 [Bacteroidales bacterium]
MNIAELKLKFFRKIDCLDKDKLEEAYGVLLNYINGKDDLDEWHDLSGEQQKGIIDGIKQIENNEGIAFNEVLSKYKNKYNA